MDLLNWKNYFLYNQSHFDHIKWNDKSQLSDRERKLITASLQQFQKGEQSEGKHLFSFAKTFPDPLYLESIRLFIKEEQAHARVLGHFMEIQNIPKIRHHWLDSIFRLLRKLTNLENTITVLLTAEIIAKPYYRALKNATGSLLLQQLCDQILKDEDQHIQFQAFTLSIFYRQRKLTGRFLTRCWHRVLMMGTILMVWMQHGKVLRSGGYTLSIFFMENMLIFLNADRQIRGIENLLPANA